jgi:negative regulator of sigma E activity
MGRRYPDALEEEVVLRAAVVTCVPQVPEMEEHVPSPSWTEWVGAVGVAVAAAGAVALLAQEIAVQIAAEAVAGALQLDIPVWVALLRSASVSAS